MSMYFITHNSTNYDAIKDFYNRIVWGSPSLAVANGIRDALRIEFPELEAQRPFGRDFLEIKSSDNEDISIGAMNAWSDRLARIVRAAEECRSEDRDVITRNIHEHLACQWEDAQRYGYCILMDVRLRQQLSIDINGNPIIKVPKLEPREPIRIWRSARRTPSHRLGEIDQTLRNMAMVTASYTGAVVRNLKDGIFPRAEYDKFRYDLSYLGQLTSQDDVPHFLKSLLADIEQSLDFWMEAISAPRGIFPNDVAPADVAAADSVVQYIWTIRLPIRAALSNEAIDHPEAVAELQAEAAEAKLLEDIWPPIPDDDNDGESAVQPLTDEAHTPSAPTATIAQEPTTLRVSGEASVAGATSSPAALGPTDVKAAEWIKKNPGQPQSAVAQGINLAPDSFGYVWTKLRTHGYDVGATGRGCYPPDHPHNKRNAEQSRVKGR